MDDENNADPKYDSEKCRTAVGRESMKRLKLIKIQNCKYLGEVAIWCGKKCERDMRGKHEAK